MSRKEILYTISVICLLSSVVVGWYFLYQAYCTTHSEYIGDVFRPFYRDNMAPIYGILSAQLLLSPGFFYNLAAVILLFLAGRFFIKSNQFLSFGLMIILVLILAKKDHPERLIGTYSHIETFAEDAHEFSSAADILKHYGGKQNILSVHNSHYPPGNLFFIKLIGISGFKIFQYILLLLSYAILIYLLKSKYDTINALPLILCPAFLIYPSLDFVVIPTFLFLGSFLFFENKKYFTSGLFCGIWTIFSFNVFIAFVFYLFYIVLNRDTIKLKLYKGSLMLAGALIIPTLFSFLTGTNLWHVFIQSIEHNISINTNGFDDFTRYWIRSTGNLLAFLIGAGILSMLFTVAFLLHRNTLNKTLGLTIIFLSFCGLFFMETERVWYPLYPLLVVSVIPFWKQISFRTQNIISVIGLILVMVYEFMWIQ